MEQKETQQESSNLFFIYEKIEELKIIQNFIRENTTLNEDGKIETGFLFGSDLLKLIKYIDTDFYNELQHRAKQ